MKDQGVIRIKTSDLKPCEKTKTSWKKSNLKFPNALQAINLFKANNNFKELIDKKDPRFLKGQLFKRKCQGARINILPDGRKIDKAFSLFAEDLTFHNESSESHWDVIYRNPNKKFAYCYTLGKRKKAVNKKYNLVQEFEKKQPQIEKAAYNHAKKDEPIAIAMIILLKTYMRVGNEMFYKLHKSKGLTTLKKSDIEIKRNTIKFKYLSKNLVPIETQENFSPSFINHFRKLLFHLKNTDFIFTEDKKPLKDTDFKKAFQSYCGIAFYPHIVRSFYATKRVEDFLKQNKYPEKKEVKELFLSISEKLGHKRFNKKHNEWEPSSAVTISHYIDPKLVEKIKKDTS